MSIYELPARAQKLKDSGNDEFRAQNYEKSVQFYTQAIEVCLSLFGSITPACAVLFSNRATAHDKLDDFHRARVDRTSALSLLLHSGDSSPFQDIVPDTSVTTLLRCRRRLAESHKKLQNVGQALWHIRRAFEVSTTSVPPHELSETILDSMGRLAKLFVDNKYHIEIHTDTDPRYHFLGSWVRVPVNVCGVSDEKVLAASASASASVSVSGGDEEEEEGEDSDSGQRNDGDDPRSVVQEEESQTDTDSGLVSVSVTESGSDCDVSEAAAEKESDPDEKPTSESECETNLAVAAAARVSSAAAPELEKLEREPSIRGEPDPNPENFVPRRDFSASYCGGHVWIFGGHSTPQTQEYTRGLMKKFIRVQHGKLDPTVLLRRLMSGQRWHSDLWKLDVDACAMSLMSPEVFVSSKVENESSVSVSAPTTTGVKRIRPGAGAEPTNGSGSGTTSHGGSAGLQEDPEEEGEVRAERLLGSPWPSPRCDHASVAFENRGEVFIFGGQFFHRPVPDPFWKLKIHRAGKRPKKKKLPPPLIDSDSSGEGEAEEEEEEGETESDPPSIPPNLSPETPPSDQSDDDSEDDSSSESDSDEDGEEDAPDASPPQVPLPQETETDPEPVVMDVPIPPEPGVEEEGEVIVEEDILEWIPLPAPEHIVCRDCHSMIARGDNQILVVAGNAFMIEEEEGVQQEADEEGVQERVSSSETIDVDLYDVDAKTWTRLYTTNPSEFGLVCPFPRFHAQAFLLKDFLYVFSGHLHKNSKYYKCRDEPHRTAFRTSPFAIEHHEFTYQDLWRFHVDRREWERVQPMGCVPIGRGGNSALTVNDRAIIFGGYASVDSQVGAATIMYSYLNETFEYTPLEHLRGNELIGKDRKYPTGYFKMMVDRELKIPRLSGAYLFYHNQFVYLWGGSSNAYGSGVLLSRDMFKLNLTPREFPRLCLNCFEETKTRDGGTCTCSDFYCSRACQRDNWTWHKLICPSRQAQASRGRGGRGGRGQGRGGGAGRNRRRN